MRARNNQGLTTVRCAVSAALVVALGCLGAYGCGSNASTAEGSDAAAAKQTQVEQQSAEKKAEEKTKPKAEAKDESQATDKTDDVTQQLVQDTQATQPAPAPEPTPAPEPASEAEPAMTMDQFPREWNGTYRGTSDNGDGPVSEWRTLYLEIYSVFPDGKFGGICHVDGDLAYYCSGKVDLAERTVSIWGTEWIEQGDLIYMCRFDGDILQDWHTMGGTKEALGGDPHPGPWELHAS